MKKKVIFQMMCVLSVLCVTTTATKAQTVDDAIMMNKKQWCNGLTYMHSSWDEYWEGTFNRNNLNLGTVTTQSLMLMSNYGITDKLNVLVNVPYVWTDASAGTLHGMKGFQDIELDNSFDGGDQDLASPQRQRFMRRLEIRVTDGVEDDVDTFAVGEFADARGGIGYR